MGWYLNQSRPRHRGCSLENHIQRHCKGARMQWDRNRKCHLLFCSGDRYHLSVIMLFVKAYLICSGASKRILNNGTWCRDNFVFQRNCSVALTACWEKLWTNSRWKAEVKVCTYTAPVLPRRRGQAPPWHPWSGTKLLSPKQNVTTSGEKSELTACFCPRGCAKLGKMWQAAIK